MSSQLELGGWIDPPPPPPTTRTTPSWPDYSHKAMPTPISVTCESSRCSERPLLPEINFPSSSMAVPTSVVESTELGPFAVFYDSQIEVGHLNLIDSNTRLTRSRRHLDRCRPSSTVLGLTAQTFPTAGRTPRWSIPRDRPTTSFWFSSLSTRDGRFTTRGPVRALISARSLIMTSWATYLSSRLANRHPLPLLRRPTRSLPRVRFTPSPNIALSLLQPHLHRVLASTPMATPCRRLFLWVNTHLNHINLRSRKLPRAIPSQPTPAGCHIPSPQRL